MDSQTRNVFGHPARTRRTSGEDLPGISNEEIQCVADPNGSGHRDDLDHHSHDHPMVHLG